MAIKARDQVKWTSNATSLKLEADTGEAFIIKDVFAQMATDDYAEFSIDKTTVGYFRNDNNVLGSHIHYTLTDSEKKTLLGLLWDRGIFKGYPVAEGQTFTVKVGTAQLLGIVYDIYEPGDISSEMENGSEAKEYMLINYGRKAASGNLANGDNEYTYSKLPSEFPEFPFGKDVPAKTTIDLYGILGSDIGKTSGTGSNKQVTYYLKLMKEREVLFNEDKYGLLMCGIAPTSDATDIGKGYSQVGNYSYVDRRLPFFFTEPLSFSAGEELTVVLNTYVSAGSANITVAEGEIAFIEKVRRTE